MCFALLAKTTFFGYYNGYYGITGVIPCLGSQYSIKAIKVGVKVSAQMRKEFEQFNSEHVGVFCSRIRGSGEGSLEVHVGRQELRICLDRNQA
jgi:hypothetical protein